MKHTTSPVAEQVVACLQTNTSPMTVGEIASAIGMSYYTVRGSILRLGDTGRVVFAGRQKPRYAARYALADTGPAENGSGTP
jgi:predicted ArsR family transcriptional regulator